MKSDRKLNVAKGVHGVRVDIAQGEMRLWPRITDRMNIYEP